MEHGASTPEVMRALRSQLSCLTRQFNQSIFQFR